MGAKTVEIIKVAISKTLESALCQDFIFTPTSFVLESPRFNATHPAQAALSLVTAELAKGQSLNKPARSRQAFITSAIKAPFKYRTRTRPNQSGLIHGAKNG